MQPPTIHVDERVTPSYYTADEKLHAAETRRCIAKIEYRLGLYGEENPEPAHCLGPPYLSNETSGSFEWYRYQETNYQERAVAKTLH